MPRKMRDSGVEWIGQVPEGWGIRRFKFVSTALRKGCGITKDQVFDDGDLPCVRYGEIYSKYINAFDRCQSKTRREFVPEPVYVSRGDILFACTGELVEEIGKNILYNGELPCVAGGDILVASHKQNAAFLNYYLNCHTSQFQKSRGKTKLKVVHARTSDIGNLLVLLPPMPEQERIAAYLDARCGEIDSAVVAARQSIEDYKALKTSIIQEVALRGVAQSVKLHDTHISWIGELPETWRTIPLKWLLTEVNVRSEMGGEEQLSMSQKLGIVPSSMIAVANPAASFVGAKIVERGDLVFNKLKAHLGVFAVSDYRGLVSPDYAVYRSRGNVDIRYLVRVFHTPKCIAEFKRYISGIGAGLSRLYTSDLFRIKVPCPPLSEQRAIADYLDEKCGTIDALVAEKESLIADLEHYKKSLIFECVTGKREVA